MTLNKETITQLAKEQVEKIKESSDGLNCFGRFFTWEELEKALISFTEEKLLEERYPQDLDKWEWCDLPFERTLENKKKLWDKLDSHTKSVAEAYGCMDTEFRDKAFEKAIQKVLHFVSTTEYYHSCTFADYFQKHIYISID